MRSSKHPLFIVYPSIATTNGDVSTIAPDFHRYIAAQRLTRLLRQLGDVIGTDAPLQDVDTIAASANARGQQAIFICFSQPQWLPAGIRCKTIAAFAWPYDTIPTQSWGEHPRHDWRTALQECAGAMVFSRHTASALATTMGPQFALHTVAPMTELLADSTPDDVSDNTEEWHIDVHGVVFDSHAPGFDVGTTGFEPQSSRLGLRGIVYTAVLDPIDDAKNWLDVLYGFGMAFRDRTDVTLVLKLCNPDTLRVCFTVSHWLQKLTPFKCRVLIIVAQLAPEQYSILVHNSSFYLSTAHAHGKAMAMLEFMIAGVPVIAPRHTATAAYLDDNNSFAIDCSREWTYWPHDARQMLTTYRYRIVWESVRQQLLHSLQVISSDPSRYRYMAAQARASGIRYCVPDLAALAAWFDTLGIRTGPKNLPTMPFDDKLGALRRVRGLLCRVFHMRGPK
jgi:hypothetical protein